MYSVENLRKRISQIRFHKKNVGPRNIVGFHKDKGHEFHNIFKFCGTTLQIIPAHVFFRHVKYFLENRFRFPKSTSTSDFTNKIRTFFVKFRFVNSATANTLLNTLHLYTHKRRSTDDNLIPV